jgi:hypothetical protein
MIKTKTIMTKVKKVNKVVFRTGNAIQVFLHANTSNAKIAKQRYYVDSKGKKKNTSIEKIIQTYSFSVAQFDYVKDSLLNDTKRSMEAFFSLDKDNCFDCAFSSNSGDGKCYTHKFQQYIGFIGMVKAMVKTFTTADNIPNYTVDIADQIVTMSDNKYVRFGTYGEPTLHPIELVQTLAENAKNWTGYTHQYVKNRPYGNYFMASTHNQLQANSAKDKFGFRSFVAIKPTNDVDATTCPASKEGGYKTTCDVCGLCSGLLGKGNRDVKIFEH